MRGQFLRHGATGIVPRLRIVFFSICATLLSAVIVGMVQLHEMKRSVNQLADISVTTFVQTERTEKNLQALLILLQQVDDSSAGPKLSALLESVKSHMESLQTTISELVKIDPEALSSTAVGRALEEIELGTNNIIDAKKVVLTNEKDLLLSIKNLGRASERVNNILNSIIHEIAVLTDFGAEIQGSPTSPLERDVEDTLFQRLQWASSTTSILLELEAIVATTSGMKYMAMPDELVEADTAIRFKLGTIAMLAARLPPSTTRVALAQEISDIRQQIVGDQGVLTKASVLVANRIALKDQVAGQQQPIEDISKIAEGLAKAGREQIEFSRQALDRVTQHIMTVMAIATTFSFIGIGTALIVVVERQINQRMARLTKAVLAIAAGERDYKVDVSGPDELGKMAGALDVFKVNAAELQRSNAELEKFAYVAAHDLRSPLRAIQDLATWTMEDEGSHFSEDSRENMGLLQKRIDRLNRLLSDLLEYSRVGMEEDNLGTVSIRKIVTETAELLDPEKKFDIKFKGHFDHVCTYETPLRHILLNLISNGIKHYDGMEGRIAVTTHYEAGRVICEVQDNGPGIEPAYHDRVFGLFQTLRPRDEVEGSGLGLAIIAKLLEHYDGSIELRSNPNIARGSSFTFDLPEKSVANSLPKRAA